MPCKNKGFFELETVYIMYIPIASDQAVSMEPLGRAVQSPCDPCSSGILSPVENFTMLHCDEAASYSTQFSPKSSKKLAGKYM